MSVQVSFRLSESLKEEAEKQASSIGLDLSEYTRMLYHLNLAELVKKAVEKEKKK